MPEKQTHRCKQAEQTGELRAALLLLLESFSLHFKFTDEASKKKALTPAPEFPIKPAQLQPDSWMRDRQEMQAGSPLIKAQNPERSRATECHILALNNRRRRGGWRGEAPDVRGRKPKRGGDGERELLGNLPSASSQHQMEGVSASQEEEEMWALSVSLGGGPNTGVCV